MRRRRAAALAVIALLALAAYIGWTLIRVDRHGAQVEKWSLKSRLLGRHRANSNGGTDAPASEPQATAPEPTYQPKSAPAPTQTTGGESTTPTTTQPPPDDGGEHDRGDVSR